MPDGRFVHPRAVWQVFQGDPDLLQYQLTQREPDRFELGLVTIDREAFERVERRAQPLLRELLGPAVAYRDNPPQRGGPARSEGKFRAVVSHCHPPV